MIDACYGLAGPLATQLLADHGPDIIRVDRPGAVREPGDLVRLRGRRSIVIDLEREAGRDLLLLLASSADVLIEEPSLDGTSPTGLSYERLAAVNPRLVHCRISGHGDQGPLAGAPQHDHLVAARYGIYNQAGWRDGPTYIHLPIPSLAAALLAVQAIGVALYQRERTGRGQEVATSLLAGALAVQTGLVNAEQGPPGGTPPVPPRTPFGATPFYSLYECGDGRWLQLGCLTPAFQAKAAAALGLEGELATLGFGTPAAADNRERIVEIVARRMKERACEEWTAVLEAGDVPHAPARHTEELFGDPQVRHEGLIVEVDDPSVGRMHQMGPAAVVAGRDWTPPLPAPLAGRHSDALCRELGLDDGAIAALRAAGTIA